MTRPLAGGLARPGAGVTLDEFVGLISGPARVVQVEAEPVPGRTDTDTDADGATGLDVNATGGASTATDADGSASGPTTSGSLEAS